MRADLALVRFDEGSPIVMTVPMSADPNWIVGEDLLDFLSLGIDSSYFVLESLASGADWEHDIQGSADSSLSPFLGELAQRFGLHVSEQVEECLRVLDERCGDTLVVADVTGDSARR